MENDNVNSAVIGAGHATRTPRVLELTGLDNDPHSYDDPRYAALVDTIIGVGLEDAVQAMELQEDQTVEIAGKDGYFLAAGPGVLFVAYLPMEAFQGDD
jgi:hypothetical protein